MANCLVANYPQLSVLPNILRTSALTVFSSTLSLGPRNSFCSNYAEPSELLGYLSARLVAHCSAV